MALQVGDITRQRIEHVEYALAVLTAILEPTAEARHAGYGNWAALTEPQRHALAALCCRLQAAQLNDTADELDREIGRILSSLQELASDARAILRLGTEAFGASGERRGTFLGELEEKVGEVDALLNSFGKARREADRVAASVSAAATNLVSHISTVRSLEADIRIMGLNTTLKCGRLGTVGRPLSIIAQELRVYANQIAAEAGAVMTNLDGVVATAASLSGGEQEDRAADIAAVADSMTGSVARLSAAGESLAGALARLEQDSEAVASLLHETVARAAAHEEIGRALRQAAADLAKVMPDPAFRAENAAPQIERMLDLLARSYTMERERIIHDGRGESRPSTRAAAVVAAAPSAATALDDILF